jgi:hypothetical protein
VPISAAHLAAFTATHKSARTNHLKYRQQRLFCRAHKTATAQQTWTARGYPTIAWDALPARLARHHAFLKAVLADTVPSHYRAALAAQRAGTSRHRTAAQGFLRDGAVGAPEMGYYGSRGARAVGTALMGRFAAALRRVGARDPLVAGGAGVGGFVQSVLVPEAVCRLVMEDMSVGEEAARRVLGESAEVGALLCEEEEDEVGEGGGGDGDGDGDADGESSDGQAVIVKGYGE